MAYIHVPYCVRKCGYCDFVSETPGPDAGKRWAKAVITALKKQLARVRRAGLTLAPLRSLYFGGGTPSLLAPDYLLAVADYLAETVGFDPAVEITWEINPQSGKRQTDEFRGLARYGFNRASIGFQAAQDELLKRLGRPHLRDDFTRTVDALTAAGIDNISGDLMFGLPGQTEADFAESLEFLLAHPVDHISYYSLQLEPGTPFYDRYADHPEDLPSEEAERRMYHYMNDELARREFFPYEISNSAKIIGAEPSEAELAAVTSADAYLARMRQSYAISIHNTAYWLGEPYLAAGPGAHSYLGHERRGESEDIDGWIAGHLDRPETFDASEVTEYITEAEAKREFCWLGLRLATGVNKSLYRAEFGTDVTAEFAAVWRDLKRRGLARETPSSLRLTALGKDLANQAFMAFIE